MIIKEKTSAIYVKDDKTYYLYGPKSVDDKLGSECFGDSFYFWLLSKEANKANLEDVIECVDPIKVWFSDFQVYKHILKKVYGIDRFLALSNKRWEFLDANKNRFQLLYTYIGDFGCAWEKFEVLCFDTLKSEYIYLNLNRYNGDYFDIKRINTKESNVEKILGLVSNSELIEHSSF